MHHLAYSRKHYGVKIRIIVVFFVGFKSGGEYVIINHILH